MISLSSFSNTHGLNKGTVHRDCQKLNIDTSKGLSMADCDRLVEHYGLNDEPQDEAPAEPAGQLQVIQPGINYTSAPVMPTAINLAALGFEPVQSLEDPMVVAQALIQAIDATEQGLDQHLSHLSDRATKTKAAAKVLADRRRQFERRLDKAELLAAQHQGSLSEAEAAIAAEAAALGKSSAAA
jgi:hypothetical protein